MAWEDELTTLARERGPALVAYASLLTGDLAAAQDLAQDALVATFSRLRRPGPTGVEHLEAYVRRAILNAFLNGRRRRERWDGIAPLVADGEQGLAQSPDAVATARADVHAALARLSPRERACVVLRHFEDLPVRDVADRLDLSEGAVKRYLSDARRRLAPLLGAGDDADVHLVEGARR